MEYFLVCEISNVLKTGLLYFVSHKAFQISHFCQKALGECAFQEKKILHVRIGLLCVLFHSRLELPYTYIFYYRISTFEK